MNSIVIGGTAVALRKCTPKELQGLSIGESMLYQYYNGVFRGVPLLFAVPQGSVDTPRSLSMVASSVSQRMNLTVVFVLPSCSWVVRQRLMEREVFFVISGKYAHLPMLVAKEQKGVRRQAQRLTPVAQYLLLYHLQRHSIEGLSAQDLVGKVPYSYSSITLGMACLEELQLCSKIVTDSRHKVVHFEDKGRQLWDKARPWMIDPVEQRMYCDALNAEGQWLICGINALAHYTSLYGDADTMVAMSRKEFNALQAAGRMTHPNPSDGEVMIEIWKYPAVCDDGEAYVDRLSLALSLADDRDPRVEKEVTNLIDETIWME